MSTVYIKDLTGISIAGSCDVIMGVTSDEQGQIPLLVLGVLELNTPVLRV